MEYRVAIYSADRVFARMLELDFSMREVSVFFAEKPQDGIYADVVLLDLDSAPAPRAESYRRMIGFSRDSSLLSDTLRRKCSMILHRPFEMKLLRREVLQSETDLPVKVREDAPSAADYQLDEGDSCLRVNGREVKLTDMERILFKELAEHRGEVLSRERLSLLIGESSANKVDVYICYLRRKLATLTPIRVIETVRGVGYRIG